MTYILHHRTVYSLDQGVYGSEDQACPLLR